MGECGVLHMSAIDRASAVTSLHLDNFRVRPGDDSARTRYDTDYRGPFADKAAAGALLDRNLDRLSTLQERLYAGNRYALLVILQGMDASGKDSAIKHVMSGLNPQGTEVHSFKPPTSDELDHDYLWRAVRVLPGRGRIGVFNRSHYEEVLIVRVHPQILAGERLPPEHLTRDIWARRYEDINAFERHLWRNGTIIRKFFLNISRAEQQRRMLQRLDDPAKNWKFNAGDLPERAKWKAYMSAYDEALAATSQKHAPWYVVPADRKWFAHALIGEVLVKALEELDLDWPSLSEQRRKEIAQAKRALTGKVRQ
jgi:PPK2 family polyphosphate:nucleotide phosphotransferase